MAIGFTCGTYDLFHAGHVLALKEIASKCTYLIVGLQKDPTIDRKDKSKPIQTVAERQIQLYGCRYVDEIWNYSTEAELFNFLSNNPRSIAKRFLGADWQDKLYTGWELPIPTYFNSRNHKYSSTELKERIVNEWGNTPNPKSILV